MPPVSVYNNIDRTMTFTAQPTDQRKERAQNAALGIGATGAAVQAREYATKQATKQSLRNMFSGVAEVGHLTTQNVKEATTLWGRYQNNVKRYSSYAYKQIMKLQNHKMIAPLLKNKIVLAGSTAFGTVMAFFALVTGVSKSIDNGKLMIGDLKEKFNLAA